MPLVYAIPGSFEPYREFDEVLQEKLREKRAKNSTQSTREGAQTYSKISHSADLHHPALTASHLMHTPVIAVLPDRSIRDCATLMQEHEFRHLPVRNEQNQIIGMISDRDVLKHLAHGPLDGPSGARPVSSIMSQRILTATADTSIRLIAQVMLKEKIHALPVINDKREIIGIVTSSDILRGIVEKVPIELWA